jgi:hypothetical protein
MQLGIFSVSDITRDPVSGETPSEAERIDAIVQVAQKAEEVGLDVFAIGEHHNPPFFSSAPTTGVTRCARHDLVVPGPTPIPAGLAPGFARSPSGKCALLEVTDMPRDPCRAARTLRLTSCAQRPACS